MSNMRRDIALLLNHEMSCRGTTLRERFARYRSIPVANIDQMEMLRELARMESDGLVVRCGLTRGLRIHSHSAEINRLYMLTDKGLDLQTEMLNDLCGISTVVRRPMRLVPQRSDK